MFRVTLRRYQELNHLRSELEERASQVLGGTPEFEHLKTLPGVGPIIALTILAEAGDVRRFSHHRQFLKYCGFDLAKQQSGTHRGREQLSKRGNARLRLAFWLAGVGAVRMRENSFRDKYERYIRAMPGDADRRRKALTAVAAKMARVAYSICKTNQPYRQFFEQALPSGLIPLLCFNTASEPFHVKTFVPELAIEAFHRPVLPGLARVDQCAFHALLRNPLE